MPFLTFSMSSETPLDSMIASERFPFSFTLSSPLNQKKKNILGEIIFVLLKFN